MTINFLLIHVCKYFFPFITCSFLSIFQFPECRTSVIEKMIFISGGRDRCDRGRRSQSPFDVSDDRRRRLWRWRRRLWWWRRRGDNVLKPSSLSPNLLLKTKVLVLSKFCWLFQCLRVRLQAFPQPKALWGAPLSSFSACLTFKRQTSWSKVFE